MVHKKYPSAVGLTLFLTAVTVADVQLVRSQAVFKLPESVPSGTNVRIDGSSSMAAVNSVLKQRFEQQFTGTQVNVAANGTPAGIQAVLAGQADVAAIGRPLNEQEKAQGLNEVAIGRDKIAILVGETNPFAKSLTITQFAKMFRGEIKNWSEVGGQNAPIKFVDRPDTSDTREAFKQYPVFKQGKFATGATTTKLTEDSTQAVVKNLGNNGISYTTANQLKGLSGAKVLPMHGVQPTNPRYPFSQPLYYIYKDGANPAVQAFLGLATTATGQNAIEKSGVATAIAPSAKTATAAKPDAKTTAANKPATGQIATSPQGGNAAQNGTPQAGTPQSGSGNPLAFLFPGGNNAGTASPTDTGTGFPNWLWWLLPIASGAALLWMLVRGGRSGRDRPATGTFNAPGYDGENPDQAPSYGTAYSEGGYDPIRGNGSFSNGADTPNADLDWNSGTPQPSNLDLDPNFAGDVSGSPTIGNLGNLGGAAAGVGVAAWAADRAKQSRIILKARSSQEAEAFWDIPLEERQAMRRQGGEKLALRLYDVTDIDLSKQSAHSVQQFECDELTQRQRLPIALPDRDYLAEIGYLTSDNQWLNLARSTHVRVPAASNFFGNAAKAGSTTDPVKSVLSGDRDTDNEPAIERPVEAQAPIGTPETQATDAQPTGWFQRITHQTSDTAVDGSRSSDSIMQSSGNAIAGGTAAAVGAGAAAWSFLSGQNQQSALQPEAPPTETATFAAGENSPFTPSETTEPPLEGRLDLTARNSRWAYAAWDIPRSTRSRIDLNVGDHLVLRLYDVTDGGFKLPSRYEQHDIDEMALSCDVPISQPDRSYVAEVGYVDPNYQWTPLARSTPTHIPAN